MDWEKVGIIGVDAGLCWIGDPCYIVPKKGGELSGTFANWDEFCTQLGAQDVAQGARTEGVVSWPFKAGHKGLGVSVSSGYGDGTYPVYIKRGIDGRIAEAKVVFISDDDG